MYHDLRHTRYINRRQAHNFRYAILYAETRAAAQGRQLNTFVTLNFDHTDCQPERVSKAFEKLRDNHFTRWLRYQSLTRRRDWTPAFYVWSIENHGGDTHVHWIVHIPKPLQAAFSEKLPLWSGWRGLPGPSIAARAPSRCSRSKICAVSITTS